MIKAIFSWFLILIDGNPIIPQGSPLTQPTPSITAVVSDNIYSTKILLETLGATTTITKTAGLETNDCSCITFARQQSGFQPPKVSYAKQLPVTHFVPRIGSWIVFGEGYFGRLGHTGIVEAVYGLDNEIVQFQGFNFPKCEKRTMLINTKDSKYSVLGYFDPRQN